MTLSGRATAGNGLSGPGGIATGGMVRVNLFSRQHRAENATIDVAADGGGGLSGGAARSGFLSVLAIDGKLAVPGVLRLEAGARGGNARAVSSGTGGSGGNANFGYLDLISQGNPTGAGSHVIAGALQLNADVTGGSGGDSDTGTGGAGGIANALAGSDGMFIFARAGKGQLGFDTTTINFRALGGNGGRTETGTAGNGGAAVGGQMQIGMSSGPFAPATNLALVRLGGLSVAMNAVGGGSSPFRDEGGSLFSGNGGTGGNATGGFLTLIARGGRVEVTDPILNASALGGSAESDTASGAGGNATGGTINVSATPHFVSGTRTDMVITGGLTANANAQGGGGRTAAGNAQGGNVTVTLGQIAGGPQVPDVGTLQVGTLSLQARGTGGATTQNRVSGGDGRGGSARLLITQGTLT
jgi:hypothetical protein